MQTSLEGAMILPAASLQVFGLYDGLGASKHVFIFRLCHLEAVWPCMGHVASLRLIPPQQKRSEKAGSEERAVGELCAWPGTSVVTGGCWSLLSVLFPQTEPFLYCLQPTAFCLSKGRKDHS